MEIKTLEEGKVKQSCRLRKKKGGERQEGGEHNDRSDLPAARETSVLVLPLSRLQTPNPPCCCRGGGVRLGGGDSIVWRACERVCVLFFDYSHCLCMCVCVCVCVLQAVCRCPLSSRASGVECLLHRGINWVPVRKLISRSLSRTDASQEFGFLSIQEAPCSEAMPGLWWILEEVLSPTEYSSPLLLLTFVQIFPFLDKKH